MRTEAGALSHGPPADNLVPGRVPRAHDGRAISDWIETAAEAEILAAGARCDPRALPIHISRMHERTAGRGSLCAGLRALHRREAVQDHSASRRGGCGVY